jgi:hypothetical protein
MMGIIPATGTEVSMGCVYTAFGLIPQPGSNIGLNSTLGVNRKPPQASGTTVQQTAIPAGATTTLSTDMGGLNTPQNYCSFNLLLFTNTSSFSGYTTTNNACSATTSFNLPIYFSTPTVNWLAASGKTAYTDSGLTTVFSSNNRFYKSDGTSTSVYSPQINSLGVVVSVTSCPL